MSEDDTTRFVARPPDDTNPGYDRRFDRRTVHPHGRRKGDRPRRVSSDYTWLVITLVIFLSGLVGYLIGHGT